MDCTLLGGGQSLGYQDGFIINYDNAPFKTVGKVASKYDLFFSLGVEVMNEAFNERNFILSSRIAAILNSLVQWNSNNPRLE